MGANERCCNIGLKIGESQDEIRFEIEDLRDVGGGERRHSWLLASRSWRANDIAGDADDAGFLTEEIKGLDGLLGKANDPLRRKHPSTFSNLNEKIAQYPGRDRQRAFHPLPRRSDEPALWRRRLVFISLHLGKIDTFDADETRLGFAPRRMQISLAIEVRHAGSHFVCSHLCNLARLSICWLF